MPAFRQIFVADSAAVPATGIDLDRKAFALRKRAEREVGVYFPSLSARTIVYKGMLTTGQLEPFFPTCPTAASRRPSRSSTRASPRTPSRPGRSPTRTASSRTTARSTR